MPARRALLLSLSLALLPAVAPRADDDHDRARAALKAGEVLPLHTVLERLQREQPGQVLEVELDREHGEWVYEIKLLRPDGRVVELERDARTGAAWVNPKRRR
ncbi:PepSY domain-containing protein [Hydrogenophaga sp.]|uniref:PepSY domain-containing protein n=1 Tax=Hydrogenophaga sp. TaxID=1904254 RepID=UPI0035B1289E